jgi:hypothetical protein
MTENLLLNKFHSDEILENLSGAILSHQNEICLATDFQSFLLMKIFTLPFLKQQLKIENVHQYAKFLNI